MHSDKTKEAIIKMLHENGGNVHNACVANGVSRKTFYEWKKSNEDFAERVNEATEISIDNVESALYKNCLEGNVTAQIFFLKVRGRSRGWVEKVGIDIPNLSSLKIEIVGEMTENEEPRDSDV